MLGAVRSRSTSRPAQPAPAPLRRCCRLSSRAAFDHAGFPLRGRLLPLIETLGHEVLDLGTDNATPLDYPDKALEVGRAITSGRAERGVIVCGSGAGVSVAAGKIDGIYACTIHDHYTAHQAVEHDGVNVLCLGGRVVGSEVAAEIVVAFLSAQISQDERHVRRRAKIAELERTHGAIDSLGHRRGARPNSSCSVTAKPSGARRDATPG